MAGAIHNKRGTKNPGTASIIQTFEFDVDNGNGTTEDWVWSPRKDIYILNAYITYTEATDSSMGSPTVKIGTTAGGSQIVASFTIPESQSIGGYSELTIVEGFVAANGFVCVRHTGIASTQAGKYIVFLEYQ